MKLLRSLVIAFAMYSHIPVPRVDWDKDSMSLAMCFFPLVGAVAGGLMYLWYMLAGWLRLGTVPMAVGLLLVPVGVSGGLHLDGFADVSDALGSHQTREKKLEILKDSHAGAFAVISLVCYMLLFFGAWCAFKPDTRVMGALAVTPVLSRALSSIAAMTFKNARGTGLLATFTDAAQKTVSRLVSCLWTAAAAGAMIWLSPAAGGAAVLGAAVTFCYYRYKSYHEFGGTTGDLAGWFTQLCELACVVFAVLAVRILEVI